MKNLIEKIKKQKPLFLLFVLSGVMAVIWDFSKKDVETKLIDEVPSADTYVPEGFVLVPIEVQNAEALDAILGNVGVVDLFHPAIDPRQKARLIARQVKIIRAPLDPKKFAVLVPSDQSQALVKIDAPLFVTVHNPKRQRTQFVKTTSKVLRVQFE